MPELDEGLYSRQIYVLGSDAMHRMNRTNVLIHGLDGLGVEIAKNIILGGVHAVLLHDTRTCKLPDLSTHYYLSPADLGKNLAEISRSHLERLNEYVKINSNSKPLTLETFDNIHIAIIVNKSYSEIDAIYQLTGGRDIKIVVVNVYGLVGFIFCDFGTDFFVNDKNGEPCIETRIETVDNSLEGIVTCLEDKRHGFEDGDYIVFSEVEKMEGLNNFPPRQIKVISPYSFSVGDLSMFSDFGTGGVAKQVKMPEKMHFKSFNESIKNPSFVISDFEKFSRPSLLHLCFYTLQIFVQRRGCFPRPHNISDAEAFVDMAKSVNGNDVPMVDSLDEDFLRVFSFQCSGSLCPMFSFFGGFAAQEVFKAVTGKFTPIHQTYYFDAFECLPCNFLELSESEFQPINSRYDAQIAVFGKKFQQILSELNVFIVGSGAIGCEHLKNIAMIGAGITHKGSVTITDMDTVERSNLNRQFLFRSSDIGKFKSEAACNAAHTLNPEVKFIPFVHRMGVETEKIFNDDFFEKTHVILNALDNVEARTYMDQKCLFYQKPLLESGTLGPKGNVQVILPNLTESYTSSYDPPEKTIPMCTLKNFPYLPEHTIQWARDLFEGSFTQWPTLLKNFLDNPQSILNERNAVDTDKLKILKTSLFHKDTVSFEDCIKWAKNIVKVQFRDEIEQLIHSFPKDRLTQHGVPFWSGTKRYPSVFEIGRSEPELYKCFITSAAKLRASNFGISCNWSDEKIMDFEKTIVIEKFTPKKNFFVAVTDSEVANQGRVDDDGGLLSGGTEQFYKEVKDFITKNALVINDIVFEKDDDTNHHIDFIYAASNLRAFNYRIPFSDKLTVKLIAGKIVPAIATTTAAISGLACLEFYKIVSGYADVKYFRNSFLNLALAFSTFSEPVKCKINKFRGLETSIWFKIEIDAISPTNPQSECTLEEFFAIVKERYGVDIDMVSHGTSLLFGTFMDARKRTDKLFTPVSQIVESVTKKKLEDHVNWLLLDCTSSSMDGEEEVEIPPILYRLVRRS
ncbi:Ubiquitin-like modifier-activating enzyme 1 [Thelohanellus kitauei]|uniref:E1 ubiquitin-activating enzyme n=1 Tax=Thelohanellus kitauei TaxID=669202 RepID=A0A0C2N149_THEKT|nr:Ubiquitin-like modifier-activating enzyme 1 [Thelohanellus kitauei]